MFEEFDKTSKMISSRECEHFVTQCDGQVTTFIATD